MNDKQRRRALADLRVQWRMWKTCKGLPHLDYALLPGTDEGDCATAYRADRLAEIETQAATLKAGADETNILDLDTIGPVELAAALSLIRPELLIAARLGVEIAHLRAGTDLNENYPGGRWHHNHALMPYTQLQLRRYPPTGDRATWVKYGPAGPPPIHAAEAA